MKLKKLVLPVLFGLSLLLAAGCSFDTDLLLTFQISVEPSSVVGGNPAQTAAGAVFSETGAVVVDNSQISWSTSPGPASIDPTGLVTTSTVTSTTTVTISGHWAAEDETAIATLTVTP